MDELRKALAVFCQQIGWAFDDLSFKLDNNTALDEWDNQSNMRGNPTLPKRDPEA